MSVTFMRRQSNGTFNERPTAAKDHLRKNQKTQKKTSKNSPLNGA